MGGVDEVGTVVGGRKLAMLQKVGSKCKTGIENDGKKVDSQVNNSEVLKPNKSDEGEKSIPCVEEKVNVFNVSDLLSQQSALVSDNTESKSSEIVEQCEQWSVKEMVELFETVSGSGLPNFQGCLRT